jgi:hypothetical protein
MVMLLEIGIWQGWIEAYLEIIHKQEFKYRLEHVASL